MKRTMIMMSILLIVSAMLSLLILARDPSINDIKVQVNGQEKLILIEVKRDIKNPT